MDSAIAIVAPRNAWPGIRHSVICRDSPSHKYTPQGVELLSSATTEKAEEAGISRTFYANVR